MDYSKKQSPLSGLCLLTRPLDDLWKVHPQTQVQSKTLSFRLLLFFSYVQNWRETPLFLLFHVSGLYALFKALMSHVKGSDIQAPSRLVWPGLPLVLCVVRVRENEETRIMSSLGEVLSWTGKGIFCGLFRERLHLCKLALARMSTPSLSAQTHA